jgi:DNA-binding GntR family transcriptional regulator
MTTAQAGDWLNSLARGRSDLERASTAERVAGVLRSRVLEGDLLPGLKLSEEAIGGALGVSRNTLREAFRLLTHERLLVHEYSRGVFVRTPDVADVADLYVARRVIEGGALHRWHEATGEARQAVRDAVHAGVDAAAAERWVDVGTANIRFHQAITGLAGSARLDEQVERLLAELRLAFWVMGDPSEFYRDYVPMNRDLLALLDADRLPEAEEALVRYFDVAENHILDRLRGV